MLTPEKMEYLPADGAAWLQHTEFNRSPTHRNRLACIVEMIGKSGFTSPRILEIGCGVGNISIPLASLGYSIKAIEPHKPSLDAAAARNPFSNLTFEHRLLEETDLAEFDIIILTEVLEHAPQYREMLDYISSRMRKDALFILTVPNGRGPTELLCRPSYFLKKSKLGSKAVHLVKRILGTRDVTTANEASPHVIFFTLARLQRLFDECGFQPVRFYSIFFLWPVLETFFYTRKLPPSWAERDFVRSQAISPALGCIWAFMLKRK